MKMEKAKKLFTKQELKEIEEHIRTISERDADFLIGLLEKDYPDLFADITSYVKCNVDIYDEDPQSQTGEMYLRCRACKKCKATKN